MAMAGRARYCSPNPEQDDALRPSTAPLKDRDELFGARRTSLRVRGSPERGAKPRLTGTALFF
jgi:hypothetical protein